MEAKQCTYNPLENYVAILVSKKRCIISEKGILIKKGVSKKDAIIKIRGCVIPKEINIKTRTSLFVPKNCVEHIEYYN
jgi:hypothetical protein